MKKFFAWRAIACFIAVAIAAPAASDPLRFSDLTGWWSADPVYGGESAHMALQFLEKDGRPEAQLSAPEFGVYGFSLGEVTLSGNSIDTKGLSFPLTWNPADLTLSGHLPEDVVPIYKVSAEFKRSGPIEKLPPRDWAGPRPKVVWAAETGSPVWAGLERDAATGMLYVGNEQGVLNAIDHNGKVRWKLDTGKPIRAQPRVIGGFVYLASDSGFLYKLDRKSGAEKWRVRIDNGSEPRIPTNEEKTRWDRYGASVVTDGKRLFIASRDKNLYALDPTTGREVWRATAGDIMTATPALHGDSVIFADFAGKVQAVSGKDGTQRWTYDAKLGVAGDVVVAGDRVLVGSRSYDLIALDAATGKERWKHYYWFSWIESPPVVRDGVVYTGSSDATNVYAINLFDGSLRWKAAVPGWSWQRTAVSDDLVIAGTAGAGTFPGRARVHWLALDRATGGIRWIARSACEGNCRVEEGLGVRRFSGDRR